MSGQSSVGNSQVYEAGDQRNLPKSEVNNAERYEEGVQHSHLPNDSKDERSIANRLANEEKKDKQKDGPPSAEAAKSQKDPTLPARSHGNAPSKGAQIDAELQAEEEAAVSKKGHLNMPGKK